MSDDLPPPSEDLEICVVVSADGERDAAASLATTLHALAAQEGVAASAYEVLVVLDADAADATRASARAIAGELRMPVLVVEGGAPGPPQRTGKDLACRRLLDIGRGEGVIASADGGASIPPRWLLAQRDATQPGASAVTAGDYARASASPVGTDSRKAAIAGWLARRSFGACEQTPAELATRKTATVSVVVPAKEVADTIGPVVDVLVACREAGLVDEVLVVDAASADGTADVAAACGADVAQESALRPEHGRCRGKGDAMWRGLSATSGEIVVFVDADSAAFDPRFVTGLLAPLFDHEDVHLVKGSFTRPFRVGSAVVPLGGGRVTEILARPLLNIHRPELAGFAQPLAGEIAARRSLLQTLPFPVGYGVEIAMLLDAHDRVGIDGLAQADLGERQNRHQSLRELSAMALAVLIAAERRLLGVDAAAGLLALPFEELELRRVEVDERPPLIA
jgi:glucosyl-3-phosphoglycerate synthase